MAVPSSQLRFQPPPILRALRHRNFMLFILGQQVSLVGTWMQTVAQSWLVYRLTGSAALLGLVGFASQIPSFLLGPVGGVAADRYSRHRIVVATQSSMMALAFILAALTLLGRIQVWHIFVLAVGMGIAMAFDIPARQAFIVEMVGCEDLMNAIALNSSMFNASRIIGPAVAGILVASIGEGWCFFANAVSFIAVIVGLLMMRLPPFEREGEAPSPLAHLMEGLRFAIAARPIATLLALLAVVSIFGSAYSVLMPIFADAILHSGARGLGILMGANGVGALVGALTLARREQVAGLGRLVAVSLAIYSVSLMAFAWSHLFWLSVALMVPAGYGIMLMLGSCNTLIQSMVPNAFRGRIMALYGMMFMGMTPVGSLIAGAIAQRWSAPIATAAGAFLCLLAAAVFSQLLPSLRDATRTLLRESGVAG
ncbi:MAG: MFS transporter [Candidatus Xenobia bacterium]